MPAGRFIIAGERRCGTTTLHGIVQQHPDLHVPDRTDMNYFVEDELVGRKTWLDGPVDPCLWDRRHTLEEYDSLIGTTPGCAWRGHKGADLFYWRRAHARIRAFDPDVRLLVVLRDPVRRAVSHWLNEVQKGRETLPFAEALEAESERSACSDWAAFHLSYGERGFYARSLKRLYETFSADNVSVLLLEDIQGSPREALAGLWAFLGVPEESVEVATRNSSVALASRAWLQSDLGQRIDRTWRRGVELAVRRVGTDTERRRSIRHTLLRPVARPLSAADVEPDVAHELRESYAEDSVELEDLLGRRIPWAGSSAGSR